MLFLEIAQANGGNDIEDAVITVPLHLSDEQRVAMRYILFICWSSCALFSLNFASIRFFDLRDLGKIVKFNTYKI